MRAVLIAVAMAGVLAAAPASTQTVGTVALVKVHGFDTPPGGVRSPVFIRDNIVSNTKIEAVENGRVDVLFNDNTQLIVGSGSEVTIDRFVYDPDRSSGEASLNVGKGVMRFITGRMSSDSYSVRMPVATLGIRGTDVSIDVAEDGVSSVSVNEGAATMTSASGDVADIDAGFTGTTDGGEIVVSETQGVPAMSQSSFGFEDSNSGDEGGETQDDDSHSE